MSEPVKQKKTWIWVVVAVLVAAVVLFGVFVGVVTMTVMRSMKVETPTATEAGSVPVGTINGRPVDGHKSEVNEGDSRVPLIANWKGVTAAGRVLPDLVDFSDFYATFAELAGAKMPDGLTSDSRSFAPQLRGEKGAPRDWAYVQLGAKWYARNDGWKLTEKGELFDVSDAPFAKKLVSPDTQTAEGKAARESLQAVLDKLNPAAGETKTRKRASDEAKPKKKERKRGTKTAKTLPYVIYSDDTLFTCSQDSQEKIKEKIKELNLNRVVIASCTSRTH